MSGGVGFYGKLPGAGDFVRRRLASGFVEDWDRHFQRAVETGRRELGGQWTDAWRHGAAWRFVLPAQVCGNGAWCGLVGPAADRLGRVFPMVLAAPCAGDVESLLGNGAWFDALERVYRSAQHEAVSVETFDARVAALPDPQTHAAGMAERWRALPWDHGQWQVTLPEGAAVGAMLAEAWAQLSLRPGAWCLWWTSGGTSLLATRGLPRSYAALLEPDVAQAGETSLAAPGFDDRSGRDVQAAPRASHETEVEAGGDAHYALRADDEIPPGSLYPTDVPDDSDDSDDSDAGKTMLLLDNGRMLVLSADDGPYHPRRLAARGIRETARGSAPELTSLRAALLALHARLSGKHRDAFDAAPENGAALVARFDGACVRLLRIGAAAAWHWRHGQLQPLFVEHAAGVGGEFDDLLFGDAWLSMPGIGMAGEPDCDETAIDLEEGDRLLLLVTRELVQLSRACVAEALALPTDEDVRVHLAASAGLGSSSAQWPLAVIGVGA